jgi:hypothetical protein
MYVDIFGFEVTESIIILAIILSLLGIREENKITTCDLDKKLDFSTGAYQRSV